MGPGLRVCSWLLSRSTCAANFPSTRTCSRVRNFWLLFINTCSGFSKEGHLLQLLNSCRGHYKIIYLLTFWYYSLHYFLFCTKLYKRGICFFLLLKLLWLLKLWFFIKILIASITMLIYNDIVTLDLFIHKWEASNKKCRIKTENEKQKK